VSTATDRRARFESFVEEVYDPLQRYLRRRANSPDADDALSETMLILWRRLDEAPTSDVLPWCYGVARRVLANQRRSRDRHLRLMRRIEAEPGTRFITDPAEAGPDPELAAALASLSPADQEILRLWAWEQLEPRELGPVLGVSVNAATIRLSRARARLAKALTRQNQTPAGHKPDQGT
jgi:RNA polymerase sigma-70 factor, ECF subfamily